MRLEIVDTVPVQPRDLPRYGRDVRSRLMGRAIRLTPPPPPVQVELPQVSRVCALPEVVGWSFGQYHFAGAQIDMNYSQITIRRVIEIVADFFGLRVNDLRSQCRNAPITRARQVAMYLAREMTPNSLPAIGRQLGHRDHTTVLHGHRKIKSLMETDSLLRKDVEAIRGML